MYKVIPMASKKKDPGLFGFIEGVIDDVIESLPEIELPPLEIEFAPIPDEKPQSKKKKKSMTPKTLKGAKTQYTQAEDRAAKWNRRVELIQKKLAYASSGTAEFDRLVERLDITKQKLARATQDQQKAKRMLTKFRQTPRQRTL